MRVVLRDGVIVLIPESEAELRDLTAWSTTHPSHVFAARAVRSGALELHDLGPREEACREPINIVSNSPDLGARLIGKFATAPFVLDGQHYVSVESFWQGLKFEADADRRRIAALEGVCARTEGERQGYGAMVCYGGRHIAVGTFAHWHLMERACRAKFAQNRDAAAALLATGNRPLTHVVRRDSTAIPGVLMAAIWMRVRARLRGDAPTR
jgi:predicted NAD-dependent protein-ADP-ribosyltransferase YbiA (DUF1768 family)